MGRSAISLPNLVAELRRRCQPVAVKQAGNSTFRRSKEWLRITEGRTLSLCGGKMQWQVKADGLIGSYLHSRYVLRTLIAASAARGKLVKPCMRA